MFPGEWLVLSLDRPKHSNPERRCCTIDASESRPEMVIRLQSHDVCPWHEQYVQEDQSETMLAGLGP